MQNIPRIESLHVKNYRALKDLKLDKLTPLTVLLGPNGSGKSTVFDVFAFLSECFTVGLRRAWERRNRMRELRSREADGAIVFELKYRENAESPLITYHLAIDEEKGAPYVAEEWLHWRRGPQGKPFRFLEFERGRGRVISGDAPEESGERIEEELSSSDVLAVNTLGQLAKHPRVSALRTFITGWYLSSFSAHNARALTEMGYHERLSETGDNLSNVIQYLKEQHPEQLQRILRALARRVPHLERVDTETTIDGRLVLKVKDTPFQQPVMARFASDGTLKLLAYLSVLYAPNPPQLIGIEEPENQLHPRLLWDLAEECRAASARTQLMVTTHSPFFVNGVRPEELWVLYRNAQGYTQARRVADMAEVVVHVKHGALLGDLWMEGFFDVGDPFNHSDSIAFATTDE